MNSILDMFRLDGRTAVVTGASSGLGATFARGLADAGANVVVVARRRERLEGLAGELERDGRQAMAVPCDVTREDQVERLVDMTLERFGRLDILVNNAGIGNVAPAEEEALDDFRRVIDVNVTAVFLCAKHAGRAMLRAGGGTIVNIASIMGLVGVGALPQAAYNTSKGAVINMTRELAAQWAKRGVRVNAVAPGWFPSEMTEGMFDNERSIRFIERRTPLGRAGRPEELVGALLLLASDASSFITGQTIVVDGGWTTV
ncbi:MAG: glucose 1-dehydrogenase [Deltaproteobacteria bacterium]|nr:glucose 1-dehydrogenase [Deltaproteobacteria bacterium]MBW1817074.1 glucose 1-dehydrogenase [Deltaproteobacteria bacterium]